MLKLRIYKFLHFLHILSKEEYKKKSAPYKYRMSAEYKAIAKSKLFDKWWYLEHNPDVAKAGKDPIEHYLKKGWKEHRECTPYFDGEEYLRMYPDVAEANMNPLLHWLMYGRFENREAEYVKKTISDVIKSNFKSIYFYLKVIINNRKYRNRPEDYKLIALSKYFDKKWYCRTYQDIRNAKIDPIEHYLKFGWKEGKNPSILFNGRKYLSVYADVKDAKINPLLHYEKYGKYHNFKIFSTNVFFPINAKNIYYEKPNVNKKKYKNFAIFASYSSDGCISDHVIYYLKELKKVCDGIIFVADNPLLPNEFNKIKKFVIGALIERHEEYDFGSYKRGFLWLKNKHLLKKNNLLVMCNDSCFGPIFSLNDVFNNMSKKICDFWGITKNIEYGEHIQSYFMCFKSNVFLHECFINFFNSIHYQESQKQVVQNYEVPLTGYLYEKGFSYDTYIEYPKDKNSYPRIISNNLTRIGKYLIEQKSPFIKIKYFSVPKWNLDSKIEVIHILRTINPLCYNLIVKCSRCILNNIEEETSKRRLVCNLININKIGNNKSVILARCNVNSSGINLYLNGVKLPKNVNLNKNMQYLLEKNDARFCFWEVDENLLNKCKNIIIAKYKEKIELKIDHNIFPDIRLLHREHKYVRVSNNVLYIENKLYFIIDVLLSLQYTFKQKILFFLCLMRRKKYTLFSELNGLANDNAFETFKLYNKKDLDSYYLSGQEIKEELCKIVTQNRIVLLNSWKHLWLFINSKKIVCSYGINPLLHIDLIDIHYSLLDYLLIYNWHGISCDDKDSIIYRYLYGTPDLCCCCSKYEKEFFENKCEYPLVKVTGNPRMDKWKKGTINNKQIFVFLTWRRTIKSYYDLVNSNYLQEIKNILKCLSSKEYKSYEIIYCIYHHFYQQYKFFLIDTIQEINPKIKIISNIEINKFNKYFATSKYLITDCSSALYDKGYQDNSLAICYLPDRFTSGHFELNDNFYDRQLGRIVHNIKELELALKSGTKNKEEQKRQKTFFSFLDNKNTQRVCRCIQSFSDKDLRELKL